MRNIFALALLSFKEGLRYRVLYGVLVFALLIMVLAVLVSGLFMRDVSKVILDFCLASINIGGLLIPFFLGINLLARDLEQHTVFAVLSRPVRRSQYILGKFGGLVLLTLLIMAILTGATFASVFIAKIIYGGGYFTAFSPGAVLASVGLSALALIILNGLVVLWCTLTTSSFLAILLTIFSYLIGQTVDDVVRFIRADHARVTFSAAVKHTVDIAQYVFPNLAAFDFKLQAAHGLYPAVGEISILFFYAAVYTLALLLISIMIFKRRDIV
ncbi:MAG: ABC transporter permease subunit [Desulfobia sp.]